MKFRTECELPKGLEGTVAHNEKIWTMGSCFADEVGCKLAEELFDVEANPLGTLFNPMSIIAALERVVGRDDEERFIEVAPGRWCSFDYHSRFSAPSSEELRRMIEGRLSTLRSQLPQLKVLMLTLGSIHCFVEKKTGKVVANCHKQPSRNFTEFDIPTDVWMPQLEGCLKSLWQRCPDLKVILTVSPVRHVAYGIHQDRLSKSALLLGTEQIVRELHFASYFPAYELLTDDLRDYRFYADDLVHPSPMAVYYVYDAFAKTFFDERTQAIAKESQKLTKRLSHKIGTERTGAQEEFLKSTLNLAHSLAKSYPELATTIERLHIG